jgi:hypothetical protein
MNRTLTITVVAGGLAIAAGGLRVRGLGSGLVFQHLNNVEIQDLTPVHAGTRAMGFDQARTFHHFRLLARGGVIEVHVNDPGDTTSAQQIAAHLEHISRQFAAGDFAAPVATHGGPPPGVATLQRRADRVRYTFEPTPVGGRVRIVTDDAEALDALHAFLRYQIREHRTGDATEPDGRNLR